jgi:aryl-alcohol dehydrogenase-like predicted oxidoreductase
MEYSPFSLEVEEFGLLKACRELGVAMVAYSPLSKSASALYAGGGTDVVLGIQVEVFLLVSPKVHAFNSRTDHSFLQDKSNLPMTLTTKISESTARDTQRRYVRLRPLVFPRLMDTRSRQNFGKNLEAVNTMNEIATRKGCTVGQLSLAWLLAQGPDVIPIPGTKKIKYLEENIAALKVELSTEEEKEIREVLQKCQVAGGRYPDAWVSGLFADSAPLK